MANLLTRSHLRTLIGLVAGVALMAPGAAQVAATAVAMSTPATAVSIDPGLPIAPDPPRDPGAVAVGASPGSLTTVQAEPSDTGPSAEYLEAMAHAADHLRFAPGRPVTIALPVGDLLSADVGTTAGPPGADAASASATGQAAASTSASTAASTTGLRREVLGFLPYWTLGRSDLRLDYSTISTIAYFAVGAGPDGHLQTRDPDGTASVGWAGWTSLAMTGVINAAHQHGARVVLTVERFAWTSGQAADTVTLLSSSALRARLAAEVAKAVHDRGADGVNLDFEPIPSGQAADYVAFVRTLRADLNARRPGYELTFDTTGSIGNYDVTSLTAPGAADAVMIMGYDYRGASSAVAGSIDPLAGPTYDLTDTIDNYLARTSAAKIILGVPYYGRAWSTSGSGLHAPTLAQTSHDGFSATATYAQAAALAAAHGRRYDGLEQAPWTAYRQTPCAGCPAVTRELYFDDAASLGLRYDMINRKGLRGAGIWALGYDGTRPELAAELRAKFINDTTVPVVGLVALPPIVGDVGFTVAWVGSDDRSGLAWYDVQVSVDGGQWKPWLTHVRLTSATYLGLQGHGYAFRVRAADGRGNISPYNVGSVYAATPTLHAGGFAQVLVDGVNLRAAPGTGAAVVLQAAVGTRVALMAGPVAADGFAWYELALPVTTWGPTADQEIGVWMAAAVGSTPYLGPIQAPDATRVAAAMTGFSFAGAGASSLGPAGAALRSFSPNGDGHGDTLRLDWIDAGPLSDMALNVFRADGSLAGTVTLGSRGAGAQQYAWNGHVGSTTLPPGKYILQLAGRDGSGVHHAPAATAVGPVQLSLYGVTLHHVGTERVAGADRYATAAAISAVAASPGVATVVIASGTGFAGGLGAAPAAAALHAPLLLVQAASIPAATAGELARLKPGRIVIVGGTASVNPAVAQALAGYTAGSVSRVSGADRYATAAAVSAAAFRPGVPIAYVANGMTFPDGVAAAAAAAHGGGPLLLSRVDALSPATMAELARLKPARIVLVGGSGALSAGVATALRAFTSGSITRLGGADRYATAAAVVSASFGTSVVLYVASGLAFPDALAGAALGQPLLLVPRGPVPAAVLQAAVGRHAVRVVALGGPAGVPAATLTALQAALGG